MNTNRELEAMKRIGQRMRDRRTYLGLKQEEVAQLIPIGRVTYTKYEGGGTPIKAPDLERVAQVLGVPVGYFFGEDDDPDIRQRELVQFFDGLPSQIQEVELEHLRALHRAHVAAVAPAVIGGKRADE